MGGRGCEREREITLKRRSLNVVPSAKGYGMVDEKRKNYRLKFAALFKNTALIH